ncbi:rhodanese-like domain-containing protein [Endozoicomonadaceae bacterium StTr2]
MFSPAPLRAAGLLSLSVFVSACSGQASESNSDPVTAISPDELTLLLQQPDVTLIDARSPDAFNGWVFDDGTLQLQQQGGHIPEAELFSARWIERKLDDTDRAWMRTGADKDDLVIIYGNGQGQANTVAEWLISEQKLEADNLRILAGGFPAWSEEAGQADFLPGFRTLVPPQYVGAALTADPDTVVVQIGWDGGKGKDYRKEHIPGALYWDDLEFEYPPIYEASPVEDIRANLARLGIDKDDSVIVYSTESIGAARGAAIMKYAGVDDVVMLNGGIDRWKAAGLPLESGWNTPEPVKTFGVTGTGDNSVIINIDEAKTLRQQPDSALVSIRAWDEFTGQVSGYNYFEKRGRIPGALWGHAGDSSWDMNHYHNPDHTMRNYHQIAEFWSEWNIRPEMQLSFYCGNGWRASEAWWYAQAMGYEKSTIYSSGWMRWREDENPVASGELTKKQALEEWKQLESALL